MNGYPDALRVSDHLRLAEDFYRAFRDLPPRTPPQSWPRYFLLCHAIELALKAYLTYPGATPKELKAKDVRHSLAELMTRATNKGLSLSPSAQKDIGLLNEAHEEFWHRYPKEDGKPVYTIDQFEPAARELLDTVSAAVFSTPASTLVSQTSLFSSTWRRSSGRKTSRPFVSDLKTIALTAKQSSWSI